MSRQECATFRRAQEIAGTLGLSREPGIRNCPFDHCCDGTSCPNSEAILKGSRLGPRTPEMQADGINRVESWQEEAVNKPFWRQFETASGTRTRR